MADLTDGVDVTIVVVKINIGGPCHRALPLDTLDAFNGLVNVLNDVRVSHVTHKLEHLADIGHLLLHYEHLVVLLHIGIHLANLLGLLLAQCV